MPTIELSESQYHTLEQKAAEAGYPSVDAFMIAFVDDQLEFRLDLDHLFTPERLAIIDAADREIDEGHFSTPEEFLAELEEHKREWLRKNAHSGS